MKTKTPTTTDPRAALANWLAPTALAWFPDHAEIGTQWARVLRAKAFPSRVHPGWLARLATLPGVMVSIHCTPANGAAVATQLNKALTGIEGELTRAKTSPLLVETLQARYRDARHLLRQVGVDGQGVWTVTVLALVTAPDAEAGRERVDQVTAQLGADGLRLTPMPYAQEEGVRGMLPIAALDRRGEAPIPFQLPSESAAAMFPFAGGGINHGAGVALGHDAARGIVLIDRWELDNPVSHAGGVTNRNWTILGASGGGKSTAVKTTLIREWAMGHQIIIVDPEREYRGMCRRLGGAWINVVGGGQVINPFVTAAVPPDTDVDDDNDEGLTAIAQQQYRVRTLLSYYLPGLTPMQQALLKQAISGVYTAKGIALDADPATVTAWPTMADLHAYAVAQHTSDLPEWRQLAALLEDAAQGVDSRLFMGHHLVAPDASFIVLDTHDVEDLDPNLKKAVLWNALGFAWNLVKRDKDATKILVVDEAWMLVDPSTPQAMTFMQNLAKRARKYNCSFNVASQNVIDFLDPSVARQGQVILNNSSFKLLLRQEPNDLAAIAPLFRLTDREQDLLRSASRGQGLLIAGNQRVWCHVEPSGFELGLMAK
ncbi:MAG: hypothetical protein M0Z36_05460 [Thermaerobacter sp.]|nr:hypothetical protein [Thermaerobacter sp.]